MGFFFSLKNTIQLRSSCNKEGLKALDLVVSQLSRYSQIYCDVIVEESTGDTPAVSFQNNIIAVSKNLLTMPPSVIAFVVAHEWGHQAFGHTQTPPFLSSQAKRQFDEDSADSYAAQFCKKHGYNVTDIYYFNASFFPEVASERNEKIAWNNQLQPCPI